MLTKVCSAFGGMVAFCVIVGDTIPHVFTAVFPKLTQTPVLWLLSDRRFVIILLILGISYPLSLYRDIAKVRATTLIFFSPPIFKQGLIFENSSVSESIYIGID